MKNFLKKAKDFLFEEEEIIEEEVFDEDDYYSDDVFGSVDINAAKVVVEAEEDKKVIKPVEDKPELITIRPITTEAKPPVITNDDLIYTEKEEKPVYEFTKVISPIYGTRETMESLPDTNPSTTRAKRDYTSTLGTVVSPMYGSYNENPHTNEVDVDVDVKNLRVEDFITDVVEEEKVVVKKEPPVYKGSELPSRTNRPINNAFTDVTSEFSAEELVNISLFDDEM